MAQIPDVHPSELIESAWGNAIRDQTVQRFASAAERDAAIPTPKVGQVAYTADNGRTLIYTDKTTPPSWRPPWGAPWGLLGPVYTFPAPSTFGGTWLTIGSWDYIGHPVNRRLRLGLSLALRVPAGGTALATMLTHNGGKVSEPIHVNGAIATDSLFSAASVVTSFSTGNEHWEVSGIIPGGLAETYHDPYSYAWVEDIGPYEGF